jgi:hypothetical protein
MANDPKKPVLGELSVDATDLEPTIVDLAPGERQGLRTAQPGCDAAVTEVVANQPTYGERAGITALTFQELIDTRDKIARIDEKLPAAFKLVELLEESRAVLDDKLQRLLSVVSKSVDSNAKARKDRDIVARYETTRAYVAAAAKKSWRTRRRNEGLVNEPEVSLPEASPE